MDQEKIITSVDYTLFIIYIIYIIYINLYYLYYFYYLYYMYFENLDFRPKIIFIVVKKRINTRFFDTRGDSVSNPVPGTVVDAVVTRNQVEEHW